MAQKSKKDKKQKKKEREEKEKIIAQKPKITLTTMDGKRITIWRNILLVDAENADESWMDEKRYLYSTYIHYFDNKHKLIPTGSRICSLNLWPICARIARGLSLCVAEDILLVPFMMATSCSATRYNSTSLSQHYTYAHNTQHAQQLNTSFLSDIQALHRQKKTRRLASHIG